MIEITSRRPHPPTLGWLSVVGALCIVAILLGSSNAFASATPGKTGPTKLALFKSHISHIIFLMQENHAFDNLYGTYCPTTGTYCTGTANGIPPATCIPRFIPLPSLGCIKPYDLNTQNLTPRWDMPHDWNSTHQAYNKGAMNNFPTAEGGGTLTMGHYNGTTVPVYWDLAEQYGLADNFFSSIQSFSLPNHWYLFGSSAPSASYVDKVGFNTSTIGQQHRYDNESNATPTIENQLVNSSLGWKYYDYPLPTYSAGISRIPSGPAYDYWNPLAARAQSYQAKVSPHFVNRSTFFTDAATGNLPNLSWVMPSAAQSDHPPKNLTQGIDWVSSVVDAVEGSPEWNSTVLFISWDEYGGFYDHVPPPNLDAYGDGFRVPLLAIGPWVRQGFIDHSAMDFGSVLHLMEKRFGLTCLGARDCNATLPLAMFNFNRANPRTPINFPTWANASYPMPLQSSGLLPQFSPSGMVPFRPDPVDQAPQIENMDWS